MSGQILRPYQTAAIEAARNAIRAGHKNILIQMPTGTGKMVIAANIMTTAASRGKVSLFAVHSRELVRQCSEKLTDHGVRHGIILPGEEYTDLDYTFCGSIQSILAHKKRGRFDPKNIDIIILDECHHVKFDGGMYKTLSDYYPNAVIIGLTATPTRTDGRGLGDFFTHLIQSITYSEAFEQGYLVPPKYYRPFIPNLDGVSTKMGDYDQAEIELIMNQPKITGNIVEHYGRYASGLQGIAFVSRVKHAAALSDAFNSAGISSAYIHGKTPELERDQIVEMFRAREIQMLVNVAVFTEGFDVPGVECIVDAAPTKRSLSLYMQKYGRGLRPATNKLDCLILDHAGNSLRFGPVEDYEHWTLETTKNANSTEKVKKKSKTKTPKDIICESCAYVFQSSKICPACKHEHSWEIIPEDPLITEGELVLASGKRRVKEKPKYSQHQKDLWISQLMYIQQAKNYKPGWVAAMYMQKFGENIPRTHHNPLLPSSEVLGWVQQQARAYYTRKRAMELQQQQA